MALRAVVFGVDGVLAPERDDGAAGDSPTGFTGSKKEVAALLAGLADLFEFLRQRGVRPIVMANRERRWKDEGGRPLDFARALRDLYGEHRLYVAARNEMPWKPRAESLATVLEKEGLGRDEVVYVGTIDADFQTAAGNQVLFCNATWDRRETRYGLSFSSPGALRQFLDLFALRQHFWFYAIDEDDVRLRSMAPYTTRNTDALTEAYGHAAVAAAKQGTDDRWFFLSMLIGSLYFSGLMGEIDYIVCAPGHEAGFGNAAMNDALETFAGAVRARYLPDLVVRHTTAASSKGVRMSGSVPSAETQFNSIRLTRLPLKSGRPGAERYKTPIKLRGKTVLVVDDFSTGGLTLEAVRHYLLQAGASVLLAPWLKTINRGYQVVTLARTPFNPFVGNGFAARDLRVVELPYRAHIADAAAQAEFGKAFEAYRAARRKV